MPPLKQDYKPYVSTTAREHLGHFDRSDAVTVDIHGHMRVEEAGKLIAKHLAPEAHDGIRYASELTREIGVKQNSERASELLGVEERLAEMDKMKVDVMAVSPHPPQLYPQVEPSIGAEISQVVNDGIHAMIKDHPKRLVGLGAVPLQNADNAVKELDRIMTQLNFKGIEIAARMANEELSERRLDPFWERCQHYDIPIFIHPTSFASDRLSDHYLTNVIGNPLDTTVAVHYLIFGGVLERFPDLKFVLSHGGAFACANSSRMDHAYGARPDCRQHISMPPSHFVSKLYPDTLVFTVDQLEYLIKRFGPDQVLIGTDYPFDMGEYDPVEHVYQVPGLSQHNRDLICGGNALRLMHMNESDYK
jgi:aminocarboxymuconate-semialdehyde decarboxylase